MKNKIFLKRTLAVIFITAFVLCIYVNADAAKNAVYENTEDFSGLPDKESFLNYEKLKEDWTAEKATDYDAWGEGQTLHFSPFTQLISNHRLIGPYVFSTDLKIPGNQFFGVFVRSTGESLSGTPYFEHDGTLTAKGEADNEGLGCTGIYVIPRGKQIILCVKTAAETEKKGIGTDKTYFDIEADFSNDYTNLKFEDDGENIKIYVSDAPVCTVALSDITETDFMSSYKLYTKAVIYGADGEEVKTVTNCRICAEYSTVAYGMRISSANIDNIYLCEYEKPAAETEPPLAIRRVDMKTQPEKSEYLIGEELDLSDTYLEITYENGVKEDVKVTEDMVEGFDNTTLGVKLLTVNYGKKSAAYSVKIVEEYSVETETERQTIDFDTSPATSDAVSEINGQTTTVIIIAVIATAALFALILFFIVKGRKQSDPDKL